MEEQRKRPKIPWLAEANQERSEKKVFNQQKRELRRIFTAARLTPAFGWGKKGREGCGGLRGIL